MTLGIFKRKYREKDHAWRVLGHVASANKKGSQAKKILKRSHHIDGGCIIIDDDEGESVKFDEAGSAQDFHAIMEVILESFLEVQKHGFKWNLRYCGKSHKVEFIPYVIFVKCDTQEADSLCGAYLVRTGGVQNLCRYCICPTNDSDNPFVTYPKKSVSMLKSLVDVNDLQGLKALSQHAVKNAFYKVRFSPYAGVPRGIHGCLLYTSPSPRDQRGSRMPSSA